MNNRIRIYLTIAVCLTVLITAAFVSGYWKTAESNGALKVGFVYSEDESTPYTYNFVQAQRLLEEEYGNKIQVYAKSNIHSREAEEPIRDLIRSGCRMLFINMDSDIPLAMSAEFPEVQFCQVSLPTVSLEGAPKNYHTFNGEIYEARYASGVAAGMKLRQLMDDGAILPRDALVGYVAANDTTEVISGFTAFLLGVRSVAPEASMRVRYTGSWSDYNAEKEAARKLIEEGCVIISQHTNTMAPAAACEKAAENGYGVYYIGYHQSMMDIAPSTAIVSIRTNWFPYIRGAVQAELDGQVIEKAVEGNAHGNDLSAGFAQDWVQLLELNNFAAAAGTEEKLNRVIEEFRRGQIDVFRGNYIGVNPHDSSDTIDLSKGYTENRDSSNPSFGYILKDYIVVEK